MEESKSWSGRDEAWLEFFHHSHLFLFFPALSNYIFSCSFVGLHAPIFSSRSDQTTNRDATTSKPNISFLKKLSEIFLRLFIHVVIPLFGFF